MWNIYNKKFKLATCQLHISLTRTAQIYLELHFCVELHTKKALSMITDVRNNYPSGHSGKEIAFMLSRSCMLK